MSHIESHQVLPEVGISGFAAYFPQRRVDLEHWSQWTGAKWDKIRNVVGESFRIADPYEDACTMGANATLNLLESYDIQPETIGLLVLATESSHDNAVGASTLRGLIDRGLASRGQEPLSRNCETYEVKQACLAGIYGIKQALRWAMTMPTGKLAVVVSVDIAEYALGSSGEPTQGAGAIATLVGRSPTLMAIDPSRSGAATLDRKTDFRKPHGPGHSSRVPGTRAPDFPVFDGPYSTECYLDSVGEAFRSLCDTHSESLNAALGVLNFDRLFFHRPYRQLPERAAATMLADTIKATLDSHADIPPAIEELLKLWNPEASLPSELGRSLHKSQAYTLALEPRLELGKSRTAHFGNLYTASLPAWVAAALTEASAESVELRDEQWLLVGYGSGDAADILIGKVVDGWRDAAAKINVDRAMEAPTNVTESNYRAIHTTGCAEDDLKPAIRRKPIEESTEAGTAIPAYEVT